MGTARIEDPLGKVVFFTKLAEAVPMESEVFCRSGYIARTKNQKLFAVTAQFASNVTNKDYKK